MHTKPYYIILYYIICKTLQKLFLILYKALFKGNFAHFVYKRTRTLRALAQLNDATIVTVKFSSPIGKVYKKCESERNIIPSEKLLQ